MIARALEEGVQDSKFKAYNKPGIRDSNFKQGGGDSRFKIYKSFLGKMVATIPSKTLKIQDSNFKQDWIQDSNLNPRKMPEIQDSDLVFKGPIA